MRILSNAAYASVHESPAGSVRRLAAFRASGHHRFWEDEISLRDRRLFEREAPATHRQVTDVYLLALARHNKGMLATFDRRIPVAAVVDADRGHLEVIPA